MKVYLMNNLLNKKCIPCEGGDVKPFDRERAEEYMVDVKGWTLADDAKSISKGYKFADFIGAVNFVNLVADIAEEESHHPDIQISYNKVNLTLTTHAIGGLSENDYIVAAKIDAHTMK